MISKQQADIEMTEFTKELDPLIGAKWDEFKKALDGKLLNSTRSLEYYLGNILPVLKKYGLSEKTNILVRVSIDGKGNQNAECKWVYAGGYLQPNVPYIPADGYRYPTTLECLREAVKQDTHAPQMMDLDYLKEPVKQDTDNG